ncbi:UDP-N-acetylmuramoyl-L-alanine--D-glutamate ligase [Sphingomonas sp. BIUV-7]|uniref:UDP-N-acetylmuramoylalanine--D-glutamate ligase n=1 Tax=Sphingomonas natans TaxID=3063330 RepID=A0ABT8Y6X7_9SPHN|nr:UDP-N-acetylmuramoyl-L-alanine--D-glutamate ligase [Sphingomonas sp. BIUV-7]MDO6413489.1 UDP-N-acetylmuramoyl-L-alanine--D-glutamate ligase [Sphingomonas sp. BIUV-7]
MITSPAFAGKRYAVLGLARSGVATVEALLASGARVTAWDSDEAKRDALILPGTGRGTGEAGGGGSASSATPVVSPLHHPADGPPPRAGEELDFADPLAIDLAGYDAVIVSPGVPLNRHPIVAHAHKARVPIIGDIELFARARAALPAHRVVGITGTNGKSTTTALIHHILETARIPSLMGGNIGLPILSRDPLAEGGVYVLELSSYQIDLTFTLDCDVAVLTNITPDHLDRYDGFEGYAASKARLFAMQSEGHAAVVDAWSEAEYAVLDDAPDGLGFMLSDEVAIGDQANWPALQGPHNAQNVRCAVATCRILGLDEDVIEQGLRTYPGLPHRMERVAEKDGVLFVNDSKATNATATAPALAAYPLIHWILGGLAKTDDLDDCAPHFDHVVRGYTIGEAGPMFARILKEAGLGVEESITLEAAVRAAAAAAKPGEVVMLSPACASFDQFTDYEARGQAFRDAVSGL